MFSEASVSHSVHGGSGGRRGQATHCLPPATGMRSCFHTNVGTKKQVSAFPHSATLSSKF